MYKVAATLDACVRSVLACCGNDAQVILVDDGSPDRCPYMCDAWAKRDSRIEVVHRPNGGLSAARNSGLAIARGTWITFVDSDDVVGFDFDALKNSKTQKLNHSQHIDIIEYPVRRHYHTADETVLQWSDATYTSAVDYWRATEGWTHCYAWNKIFRRTLFDGVRFPEGRVFEDIWTIPVLLQRARGILTVTYGWYGYSDNPDGITMTAGGAQLMDLLQGNINAVRVMGVCDVRHYSAMINIQLDVYRRTKRIMLFDKHFPYKEKARLPWPARLKMLLPIRYICWLHRHLVS